MRLLLIFVLLPLIEIALFVQVGAAIGLWLTLALVILSAVFGVWILRAQGALAAARLRNTFHQLGDPAEQIARGTMVMIAGMLLIAPGFFTDTIGLLLLVPYVQTAIMRYMQKRMQVHGYAARSPQPEARGDIIEGEWEDVTLNKKPTHMPPQGPSGWTRH
ncbi:MAG: FxsA family protein [Paracoccaceae bacterium]